MTKKCFRCNVTVVTSTGSELKRNGDPVTVYYDLSGMTVSGFAREVSVARQAIKKVLDRFIEESKLSIVATDGETVLMRDVHCIQLKNLVTCLTGKLYQDSAAPDSSIPIPAAKTSLSSKRPIYVPPSTPVPTVKRVKPVNASNASLLDLPDVVLSSIFTFSGKSSISGVLRSYGDIAATCTAFAAVIRSLRRGLFIRAKDMPVSATFLLKAFYNHGITGTCSSLVLHDCQQLASADWTRLVSMAPVSMYSNIKHLSLRGSIAEKQLAELIRAMSSVERLDILDIPSVTPELARIIKARMPMIANMSIGAQANHRMQSKLDNEALSCFTKCSNLTHLTMPGCDLITEVPIFNSLVHLDLSKSSVTSLINLPATIKSLKLDNIATLTSYAMAAALSKLPNLELLDLSQTNANNDVLAKLRGCGKLRRLKVSGCRGVTDPGVKDVLENAPELELLDVSNNWQISHALFTADTGISRVSLNFQALGLCKTNLIPIFAEQVANHLLSLTGRFGTVFHQHPLEAIDNVGKDSLTARILNN